MKYFPIYRYKNHRYLGFMKKAYVLCGSLFFNLFFILYIFLISGEKKALKKHIKAIIKKNKIEIALRKIEISRLEASLKSVYESIEKEKYKRKRKIRDIKKRFLFLKNLKKNGKK